MAPVLARESRPLRRMLPRAGQRFAALADVHLGPVVDFHRRSAVIRSLRPPKAQRERVEIVVRRAERVPRHVLQEDIRHTRSLYQQAVSVGHHG